MTYRNVNNFIVIADDDRDANTSFANHRKRKSRGGVDVVAAKGTPIYAPGDCILSNHPNNGSGGNTITMAFLEGGWVDQMMHLSRFVESGFKAQGELVGYSGDSVAPGFAPVDPHVHWHRLGAWYEDDWGATNRYNPFNYFVGGNAVNNITEEDEDMDCIIISAGEDDNWAFYWYNPLKDAKRLISTPQWNQLELWAANDGLPLKVYPLAKNLIHTMANF